MQKFLLHIKPLRYTFCRLQYNGPNLSTVIPPIDVRGPDVRSESNGYLSLAALGKDQYLHPCYRAPTASSSSAPTSLRDKSDKLPNRRIQSPSPDGTPEPFHEQATSERISFGRMPDTERSRHPPSPLMFGNVANGNPHSSGMSSPSRKRPRLDLVSSTNTAEGASSSDANRTQRAGSTHWHIGRNGANTSSVRPEADGKLSNGERVPELRSIENQGPSYFHSHMRAFRDCALNIFAHA